MTGDTTPYWLLWTIAGLAWAGLVAIVIVGHVQVTRRNRKK